MDLFETETSSNAPEYSVSEISSALKKTVEENFSHLRVRGELGRVVRAASGHIYVDLKDEKAVINCNIWRPIAERLEFLPEEGMEVIATGKLSTYAPQSKYNLIIEKLEIAGEGALMALLEKRRKALAAEGLFDPEKRQPIPFLPNKIGVITSKSGAVIRDILHRLEERFPREVLLWPVAVQGKNCAAEVSAAILGFNALPKGDPLRPDVIIVARGGGSIEDLWGFNEEVVVRATAASKIPIISAVGHETDTTLIDYAADKRAPTPSAAAEISVPVRADLYLGLKDLDLRLARSVQNLRKHYATRLADLSRALPKPTEILALASQRLDIASSKLDGALLKDINQAKERYARSAHQLSPRMIRNLVETKTQSLRFQSQRLEPVMRKNLERLRAALETQARVLGALSYTQILERGFAVILDESGKILKSSDETRRAGDVVIRQKDGETHAKVKG